jgi:hypothetical protein
MINKVFLKIHDFDCSIETINETLKLLPTTAWLKGEDCQTAKGIVTHKNSLWQLQADIAEEKPLEEHVNYMVDLIKLKSNALKQLTEKYESEFTILSKCNEKAEFNYGLYLNNSNLEVVSNAGLNLDMDVYFLPKSDKE